jgi:hypothetical protein
MGVKLGTKPTSWGGVAEGNILTEDRSSDESLKKVELWGAS